MISAVEDRKTLTLPEFARALGIPRSTIYALASKGQLPVPVIPAGRRKLVSKAAVEQLLASFNNVQHGRTGDSSK